MNDDPNGQDVERPDLGTQEPAYDGGVLSDGSFDDGSGDDHDPYLLGGARKKKRGFLMGQVMRELKGKGNAQVINQILEARLAGE